MTTAVEEEVVVEAAVVMPMGAEAMRAVGAAVEVGAVVAVSQPCHHN